jgi:hypothetical protein
MPVYPIHWQAPTIDGRYRGVSKHDARVWERFLRAHASEFLGVAYGVAFGGVIPDDPNVDEAIRLGWQYSTAKKVDALADHGDEVWCCEIKPRGSLSAIGQALGAVILMDREHLEQRALIPAIICEDADPDVEYIASVLNVQLVIVGFTDAAPAAPPPATTTA